MKKTIALLLILLSFQSLADCNDAYRVFHVKKNKKGTIFSSVGAASPLVGTGLYSVAWEIGSSIGVSAAQKLLVMTSLGMTIAAPVTTVVGLISFAQAANYRMVKNILDQSQVEMGKDLEDLAENLSDRLERDIQVSDIAPIINQANDDELFCQKDQKLYNSFDLKKYIISELN